MGQVDRVGELGEGQQRSPLQHALDDATLQPQQGQEKDDADRHHEGRLREADDAGALPARPEGWGSGGLRLGLLGLGLELGLGEGLGLQTLTALVGVAGVEGGLGTKGGNITGLGLGAGLQGMMVGTDQIGGSS